MNSKVRTNTVSIFFYFLINFFKRKSEFWDCYLSKKKSVKIEVYKSVNIEAIGKNSFFFWFAKKNNTIKTGGGSQIKYWHSTPN